MMKNITAILSLLIIVIGIASCGPDDDTGIIPIRDRAEVDVEDQQELIDYLQTHFWNYEEFATISPGAEFRVVLDTIEGANANKIPLINQVTSSVITVSEIDYTIYTLKVRQGGGSLSPTFADSALVSYQGTRLDREVFDSSSNALWFDLPSVVPGFMEGIRQFNESSSLNQNPDGTVSYVDSGIGAVFMPSGAAYFSNSQTGIPSYTPIAFTFSVRAVNITDHDSDGIFSKYEDVDNDQDLRSPDNADNTDEDNILLPTGSSAVGYNYLDNDDDGDGVLTIFENPDPNGDGNPDDAIDADGDGIPAYLDNDEFDLDLDDDGIRTAFESPDPNGNGNPSDALDTDNDGIPNYIDADDDGDGIPTIQENADPNGDRNPEDALDSDNDGIPDYLDSDS